MHKHINMEGFFDNEIAIKQIRETLGDDYLRDLMEVI